MKDIQDRILVIDALRGFALAGIVLVHFVEQFLGGPIPEEETSIMIQGIPDYIVLGIIQLFFSGKFFALFSILFGLSFYIQMNRAAQKGKPYKLRFIWRLAILMLIGLIHSLFYRGDILTIYVVVGLFLPLFHNVSNKWLLIISGILFLGLGRFLVFALHGSEGFFGLMDFTPNSEFSKDYFKILSEGTIMDVFKDNITNGLLMKIEFQFGTFNRGYLTFAMFLIGMWFGRIQLFENIGRLRNKLKEYMWYALGFSLLSLILMVVQFSQIRQPIEFNNWPAMIAMHTMDLMNLGMTGFILLAFLIVYGGKKGYRLNILAPYGRMALTNYVMQSIIGTFIFFGWGLGMLAQVRNLYTFLFGFVIIVVQIILSKWWISKFYYGPFEWIWRCLTWTKWMPLVRGSTDN